MNIVGVLLAAGRGSRYGGGAARSKLLATRSSGPAAGLPIAVAAARALRASVDTVIAVVRQTPGALSGTEQEQQERLCALLREQGCRLQAWVDDGSSVEGSGTSIACAVQASAQAQAWLVALADMPDIRPASIDAVCAALRAGAASAAPWYRGRRGHPVGFGAECGPMLAALSGDGGARSVLARYPPQRIDVDDPGVLYDVDSAGDE